LPKSDPALRVIVRDSERADVWKISPRYSALSGVKAYAGSIYKGGGRYSAKSGKVEEEHMVSSGI